MTRISLLLCLLTTVSQLFSQEIPDVVDQYNEHHKKTGLWTVYLDKYTNQVEKEKAVFIGYEQYDNGECVFPFAKYSGKKNITVEFDGQMGEPGNPVPLNGTHRIIYSDGQPSYESTYQNGRPVLMQAYRYDKKGLCCMTEILDFENRYNDIDGTFYYERFSYDNQLIEKGYYRKGDKNWYMHKE